MKISTRLQTAIDAAKVNLQTIEDRVSARSGGPKPGDMYVMEENILEWLVIREHPDDSTLLFIVPTDDFPFAGTPDVDMSQEASRPLFARCGWGAWVPTSLLQERYRVDALPEPALALAREMMAKLARGKWVSEPSVDNDPEYADWIGVVAQASGQLTAAL